MEARRFILTRLPLALVAALVRPATASAPPRIGLLRWVRDPEQERAFQEALQELGYVESRSIAMEWRWAEGRADVAARHAEELVRLNVALIVAAATPGVKAAREATRTIPIVMSGSADPVASGFAASLARPGGNVTGISYNLPALTGKRVELLRQLFPDATRVAFLGARRDPAAALFVEEAQKAGQRLGLQVHVALVNDVAELDGALAATARAQSRAVIVQPLLGFGPTGRATAELALKHRLPAVSDFPEFAENAGLLSYGPSRRETMRRVAVYVDRILRGARPGDLPIEEPSVFELVVNARTARALGLTIPPALLLRADRVIE